MTKKNDTALLLYRRDLRLSDHQALALASRHRRLYIVYAHDQMDGIGEASRWFLHHLLEDLANGLAGHNQELYFMATTDAMVREVCELVATAGIEAVYWTRRYEPGQIARDKALKAALTAAGVAATSCPGYLLREPWEVAKSDGSAYQVYTPFWKAFTSKLPELNLAGVPVLPPPPKVPLTGASRDIAALALLPDHPWHNKLASHWQPQRSAALARLAAFVADGLSGYDTGRDVLAADGTSALSPYLHFGTLSPQEVWLAISKKKPDTAGKTQYLKEIVWREFAYHLLYFFPQTSHEPLRPAFARFPWRDSPKDLTRWQQGRTGYPIVDAGMRQLWETGWMHNRVRMIVASFLVKHLRLPWQAGAAWFWDTLVDADLASNTFGWQWAAGCGADAAPYFRIFNPMLQGKKFDGDGRYVRRYVPELTNLPAGYIHRPFDLSAAQLADHGVRLGKDYPTPIVDHKKAREAALAAFAKIKS